MCLAWIVLLCLPTFVVGETCDGRSDGQYEISCRSYLECTGGVATLHSCSNDGMGNYTVYNSATGTCDDRENVQGPCGRKEDCTTKTDGRYPDIHEKCRSYYTCVSHKFDGHNFCPADLVFDRSKETCNYKENVAPPCGTLGMTTSPP